ncbi:MAG: glycosyltransferase [bacterium]
MKALLLLPEENDFSYNHITKDFDSQFDGLDRIYYGTYCIKNGIGRTEKHILGHVEKNGIPLVIVCQYGRSLELSVEFYNRLRRNTAVVFWNFDDAINLHSITKYFAQVADAVVTEDYFACGEYEKLGIPAVLWFASFSSSDYPQLSINKDIDVSFIGNYHTADRREYVDFLARNGVNVVSYGKGSKNGFLPLNDIPAIFARSKINLNFTKSWDPYWINEDEPLVRRVRQNKGRPVQIALTRSFCLSEACPTLDRVFSAGKEIDIFRDKNELLDKIHYYLENGEKRELMAAKAHERAMAEYEAGPCLKKVFNSVKSIIRQNSARRINGPLEIYLSKDFIRRHVAVNIDYAAVYIIKHARLRFAVEMLIRSLRYGAVNFIFGFFKGLRVASGRAGNAMRKFRNVFRVKGCCGL